MNKTTTDLRSISEFFTEAEWEAISSAMSDFSDYGDTESEIANDILVAVKERNNFIFEFNILKYGFDN